MKHLSFPSVSFWMWFRLQALAESQIRYCGIHIILSNGVLSVHTFTVYQDGFAVTVVSQLPLPKVRMGLFVFLFSVCNMCLSVEKIRLNHLIHIHIDLLNFSLFKVVDVPSTTIHPTFFISFPLLLLDRLLIFILPEHQVNLESIFMENVFTYPG